MSFNFLQSISDSIPTLNQLKETVNKVNKEQFEPLANKVSNQISLININNITNSNIQVSELPPDYLQLEKNCDLLRKLYDDLVSFNSDTYVKVSYDYPPASTLSSNVSDLFTTKINIIKNAKSPQDLEKVFVGDKGKGEDKEGGDSAVDESSAAGTSAVFSRTLYGKLAQIAKIHSEELKSTSSPISQALAQISETNNKITSSRLNQDKIIVKDFNSVLVSTINEEFSKVNLARKNVYLKRSDFDYLKSISKNDEENEELIAKEDDLVSATESAVAEMKKLINPSKNLNLLKVLLQAQQEFHESAASKLKALTESIDKIEIDEEDED